MQVAIREEDDMDLNEAKIALLEEELRNLDRERSATVKMEDLRVKFRAYEQSETRDAVLFLIRLNMTLQSEVNRLRGQINKQMEEAERHAKAWERVKRSQEVKGDRAAT